MLLCCMKSLLCHMLASVYIAQLTHVVFSLVKIHQARHVLSAIKSASLWEGSAILLHHNVDKPTHNFKC